MGSSDEVREKNTSTQPIAQEPIVTGTESADKATGVGTTVDAPLEKLPSPPAIQQDDASPPPEKPSPPPHPSADPLGALDTLATQFSTTLSSLTNNTPENRTRTRSRSHSRNNALAAAEAGEEGGSQSQTPSQHQREME